MTGAHLANSEMNAAEVKEIHCRDGIGNSCWCLILNITITSTDDQHTIRQHLQYTALWRDADSHKKMRMTSSANAAQPQTLMYIAVPFMIQYD